MPGRILIVEDDPHLSQLLTYNLEKEGYSCQVAVTGEDALAILDHHDVDLILLDIMLPKVDGLTVCRRVKADPASALTPVIILSAKGEEVDRVVGLELGADDYLVKPFSIRELLLRVKKLLARVRPQPDDKEIIQRGALIIDIPRHRVTVQGDEVPLTAKEFQLLVTLARRVGRLQTRDRLLRDVWDIDADVTTRTVDTHVKSLRQKLGPQVDFIETVRGYGYRFREEP